MIAFVNAKINIGLSVVERRQDGYHNLETVFYPVGKNSGTPSDTEPFDDLLEITPAEKDLFIFKGNSIDCGEEDNLVCKAVRIFREESRRRDRGDLPGVAVRLDKFIPSGAGLGGGSADASFTLRILNDMTGWFSTEELASMALNLGADCPFFIYNRPMFGEGVGEILSPIDLDLSGCWLVTVKDTTFVSTRDAFAGIVPRNPDFDLRLLPELPIEEWERYVVNDFEATVFSCYPSLLSLKERMREQGAVYSAMTGSGAVIYGIFLSKDMATAAASYFREDSTLTSVGLLSL